MFFIVLGICTLAQVPTFGTTVVDSAGLLSTRSLKETHGFPGHDVHGVRVSYFQGSGSGIALVLEIAGHGEALRVFTADEFKPPAGQDVH